MFWKHNKNNERLFKFVYNSVSGYKTSSRTLLVVARDHTEAVKEFYQLVDDNVSNINITEFTEVKYSSEEGVASEQS